MHLLSCWLLALFAGFTADEETLDQGVLRQLEFELERGFQADSKKLYIEVVRAHGDVDLLLDRLEEITDDEEQDEARRLSAKWMLAGVLRRYGNQKWSLELTEELAEAAADDAGVLLQQAQLYDARGSTEEALGVYERLLELLTEEAQLGLVRLRIAMIQMDRDKDAAGALADFVREEGRDPALRNRGAVVLALLGRPGDAIDLFEVTGEGKDRFRQEVRVAEWAIRADDPTKAQDYAWIALHSATLRRDRHYALTVLVEAYRMDDSLDALIERFSQTDELPPAARNVWIDLLRETGRVDEAIALFRESRKGDFDVAMRRELVEMYREAGQEDTMVRVYTELISEEPTVIEWREGLSRFLLERGNRAEAEKVWESFVNRDARGNELLWGANTLADLGLDSLAIECAETFIESGEDPSPALLFLFSLHKDRGDLAAAEAVLERLDAAAPPDAAARLELAESFEQLGKLDSAVGVLEGVRESRTEGEVGEDLEMRLSWLYSEVGDEEKAMESWLDLWRRIQSIPRRRYVEDRLMTVASRLGTLADVAIELEDKLAAGEADERESGLLVRLYTKVSDPVSATEVVEEFMKQTGGNLVETLQEKARVYVACTDYHNYEKVVRQLIDVDPEGLGDYLRQLAMSQLERGKPDEAREVLLELKELEGDTSDSAEFEAGVLALAGMRDEAIVAYRRGLAEHPERIDSYLLMADLMKSTGETEFAIGMFQHLAETAERDDLFTIAIDGLLNMEAPAPTLNWAKRITLERLTGRHDKMYLYQLLSDLSEELEDREDMVTALENSLAISGERRPSVLRELMDLAKGGGTPFGGSGWAGDTDKHLAFGRRLIGLEDLVPPQVYLDLGEAFLKADDVSNAAKTFRLAHELPDYDVFQRQAAGLFETSSYLGEALRTFERVLVTDSSDVSLMAKVAELQEQMGRDEVARELYLRAIELLLLRRPLTVVKAEENKDTDDPFAWFAARNVDDFDQYYERVLKGVLVTVPEGEVLDTLLTEERERITDDLEAVLALASERDPADAEHENDEEQDGLGKLERYPRLMRRAEFYRRLAFAYGRPGLADALDLELLKYFEQDEDLLEAITKERIRRGHVASARSVIERCGRPEDQVREVLFLVGEGVDEGGQRLLPLAEASGLFLPLLISDRREEAKTLLRRIDLGELAKEELPGMSALFAAAQFLDDPDLKLHLGRQWLRMHIKHGTYEYELQPVLDRCRTALDPQRSRSLCQYFVSLVLEEPEKTSGLITMLPRLQSLYEEPLVTEEQVMDLLDDYGDAYAWGLGPVLRLLPAAERASALRRIWPKVQNTYKASFLIQVVSQFTEPLGEELAEFISTSFPETLEDATNIKYQVDQLHEADKNAETALRMAEAMVEQSSSDWPAGALRAVMLSKTGQKEAGLEAATEVYVNLMDTSSDYYLRRAQEHIEEEFLPDHIDAFAARLERVREEQGDSLELALKQVDLSYKTEDPEQSYAAIQSAIERFPEETDVYERLQRWYQGEGRSLEALEALEKIVELEPDEPKFRRRLYDAWLARSNPVRALQVREGGSIEVEESNNMRFAPGTVVVYSSGGVVTYYGGGPLASKSKKGEWPEGKARPATIERVKEALEDEQDAAEAAVNLRRLWRNYPKGEGGSRVVYYFGGHNPIARLKWPKDEEEGDEEEAENKKERKRGGLEDFKEEEDEEEPEQESAWRVLAEHDFAKAETERLLRTTNPAQMDAMQPVCEALLHARTLRSDTDSVLRDLLGTENEGAAGKVDYILLLALLDEHPDKITPDVKELLRDLVGMLNPLDGGQLRRLARTHARAGSTTEATRLYRWCATQTQSSSPFVFNMGGASQLSANDLVKEVKETLEGDDLLAVIEAILDFADPGEDRWARENYEYLVMDTWEEMYGPEVALEKTRKMCQAATDPKTGLRRRTAKRAAYLYARNGEIDRAIECLEFALCKLDPELFQSDDPWWRFFPENMGNLSTADLRRFFPREHEDWPDNNTWLRRAARALEGWLAEERVSEHSSAMALALIAKRLSAAGETEEALRIVDVLDGIEDLSPTMRLWVADAAREAGRAERGDAIERELLETGRLGIGRLPEVVERVFETEGPEPALELGEAAAELTLHPDLLDVLVRVSEAAQDPDRIQHWRGTIQSVEDAEEQLKQMDEEGGETKAEEESPSRRR